MLKHIITVISDTLIEEVKANGIFTEDIKDKELEGKLLRRGKRPGSYAARITRPLPGLGVQEGDYSVWRSAMPNESPGYRLMFYRRS